MEKLAVGNVCFPNELSVVRFLDSLEKVNSVQSGVVIQDTFTHVMPLTQPARTIILSNVPPYIKDDLLIAELSRYGKNNVSDEKDTTWMQLTTA